MTPRPRSLMIGAALLVPAVAFTAACGTSERPASQPTHKAAASAPARPALQSQLRQVVAAGAPGAIALVNDGHSIRLHSAGVADTRSGRAMRPTDRFRAGSMTKSFVATVALQLVAEGKL